MGSTKETDMKVLVVGSTGMIGSGLCRYLAEGLAPGSISVKGIPSRDFRLSPDFDSEFVDGSVNRLLDQEGPYAVINCVGIVKQRVGSFSDGFVELINTQLPISFSSICSTRGVKFVHVSSDCVFSGIRGNYSEEDTPDADDIYGKSKSAADASIDLESHLIVRTSTIGLEKREPYHGLLMWYLGQDGEVPGYLGSIYSGVSLRHLSRCVAQLVLEGVSGLYHVASDPITKYDLLALLSYFGVGSKVIPVSSTLVDRTLNDSKFRHLSGIKRPHWAEMILDVVEEVRASGIR